MQNYRTYGKPPFDVVVVHGGPGAAGEMAPVARELALSFGVLEALQTANTVAGQVEELRGTLENCGGRCNTLIGFSWGAWLSCLLAADHPSLVRKLILIGTAPFEDKYVAAIQTCRVSRLSADERIEFKSMSHMLDEPDVNGVSKTELLKRLEELTSKTDTYEAIDRCDETSDAMMISGYIYEEVWTCAAEMRRTGKLLEYVARIACPVVAIHGAYDPHPTEGVEQPLSRTLANFRFIPLNNCGHKPWIEGRARDKFYEVLRNEARS